ncbi:right-handed parallel beta-helix repeat-containing protein [Paenibacillus koleovorans]|uniref:right-handed parallel beta-helix repeat-containing protein n=1 Tax=Paenibacillus koleovorans TaxID=121608 RepID=UPI0024827D06|nr:right-handed parallel beta-helix repeat-containing protein [Paenibacillus koleovorans]
MNGCRGGAIYFYQSNQCTIEEVAVTDFNGEGVSSQISEDFTIRHCEITGSASNGLHPGTGSLRSHYSTVDPKVFHVRDRT